MSELSEDDFRSLLEDFIDAPLVETIVPEEGVPIEEPWNSAFVRKEPEGTGD